MTLAAVPMDRVDHSTGEVLDQPAPAPRKAAFLTAGEPKELARLFAKMSAVLAEIGRVAKAGENTQQNYRYATAADLLDTVRPLLAKHGIAFVPTVVQSDQHREGKKVTTHIELQVAFCCADTGAMLVTTWHGEADDWGDKGYWKAYTGTLKYALFQTFLVSTGDDPEAGAGEDAGEDAGAGSGQEQAPSKASRTRSAPAAKPERTELHTRILSTINERRKLLPDGYACTVGKTQTGDLKAFVAEHWGLISENLELAKRAVHVIDDALKATQTQQRTAAKQAKGGTPSPEEAVKKLHGRYFALMSEKYPRLAESDRDRHVYQKEVVGKESTNDWTVGDYEKAILGIEDGSAAKYELPM